MQLVGGGGVGGGGGGRLGVAREATCHMPHATCHDMDMDMARSASAATT